MKAKRRPGCLCVPVNSWGLLGPKKKESIFLSYPLCWPLGTNPKLRAIPPSQAPRYQHPAASQGSLVAQAKQHLRDTLAAPDLPHATPVPPERSCFVVCRRHTRCSGGLLSHSPGLGVDVWDLQPQGAFGVWMGGGETRQQNTELGAKGMPAEP